MTATAPPAQPVPYVPTAADLVRHGAYLIERAAAERPRPLAVSHAELAWVSALVRTVELDALALPNASSRIVTLTVVELFRHGRATVQHIAVAHAAGVWTAQYRAATEGVDRWADERAELLRILAHMALDVAERRGYAGPTVFETGEPFGVRLAHLRARAALTQAELADALETSESTVRNWERGRYFPQLPRVHELCELLSCSLRDLLGP